MSSSSDAAAGDEEGARGRKKNREKKRKSRFQQLNDDPNRKTRWKKDSAIVVPVPPGLSPLQQHTFILRMCLEDVNRRLLTVAQDAKLKENDKNRSPSPEPQVGC